MHRRSAAVLLAFALATTAAGDAAGPVTDEAVVATDSCVAGPDPSDVMLDEHDLCEVVLRVTTGEDVAPRVEVDLRLAAAPIPGSAFTTGWSVSDCYFLATHEDDLAGASGVLVGQRTRLTASCGEPRWACTAWSEDPLVPVEEADCYWVFDDAVVVDLPTPVADDATLTFAVDFDGALAPFAASFAPGAVLQQRSASAAPDLPVATGRPVGGVFVCDVELGCSHIAGDLILGGGTLTVSS